ncbi:MAG TPA: hypothetical protein VMT03_16555 [Polyangia bacterium]|nr:hypothetical protein [Polyangia bacterium]
MSLEPTDKPIVHTTFTLERTYPAAPSRVFAAFADPEVKARWFIGPEGWHQTRREPRHSGFDRLVNGGHPGRGADTTSAQPVIFSKVRS